MIKLLLVWNFDAPFLFFDLCWLGPFSIFCMVFPERNMNLICNIITLTTNVRHGKSMHQKFFLSGIWLWVQVPVLQGYHPSSVCYYHCLEMVVCIPLELPCVSPWRFHFCIICFFMLETISSLSSSIPLTWKVLNSYLNGCCSNSLSNYTHFQHLHNDYRVESYALSWL